MKIVLLLLALVSAGFSQDLKRFDYRSWKNTEGKEFEARLDSLIESGKKVVLQAKNGGMRYTLPLDKLSNADGNYIFNEVEDQKDALKSGKADALTLYKAAALGLSSEIEASIGKIKSLSLKVTDYTISTDKMTAEIELEGAIFARILLPASYKDGFVERSKSLCIKGEGRGYYWWGNVKGSDSVVATKGSLITFDPTQGMRVEWGRVGVVDGPIFWGR